MNEPSSGFDRQVAQERLLDYFEDRRYRGRLEDADATLSTHNPSCGDVVTMYLHVRDDRAATIRFDGRGCTVSQAAAALMAEWLEGGLLAQVEHVSPDAALAYIGRDVVGSRVMCATLGLRALQGALRVYRRAHASLEQVRPAASLDDGA